MPSPDGLIRTAVVGYGLAGSAFHAPVVDATDGMAVTAVVTRNPERSDAARARYPGVHVVADFADLFRRPDEVDLVVIATPNRTHVSIALAAIEAGRAVVIDKPVAATAAEARRVRDAAVRRGLLVSVFHNRRWDGDALTLTQLLADGDLGRVHRFESRFERWRPQVNLGSWREQPDPDDAGGLLYDLGSHLIDQALRWFGPVTSVYAELRTVRPRAQVDDDVFIALSHAGGTQSHLWASAVAADLGPRFRVLGSAGSFVKYGLDVQEDALRAGGSPSDVGWGAEPETAWGQVGTPGHTRTVRTLPGAYQHYYEDLRDALRGHKPPPVTIAEAIDVIGIIEAAEQSARDGVTVGVTD